MSTVHVKIEIDAPVERVWETIMDPHRLGEWVTIHRSVRDVSDRAAAARARRWSRCCTSAESRSTSTGRSSTSSAPHRAEWEGRGPAHSRARIVTSSRRREDGRTAFDYTNEFTTPGGRLGNVASRVIVGAAPSAKRTSSLARLKALLERN